MTTPPMPERVAPAPVRGFGFEDVFGRRLPIWAGGVTLAVCGVLIVRYSIETGLLTPALRVIAGLLFGGGLIAGAESARRHQGRVRDPRVPQALAGAGVVTLYAATLIATDLYALVGPIAGFVGLALVTGLAALLSIRFGAPAAVLALAGGLAAPALVRAGNPDVPSLSAYLTLAIGGLATLGRVQRWPWLDTLAMAGGFGWGAAMLLAGTLDADATVALGLYLLLTGLAMPALAHGRSLAVVRWAGALMAAVELGAMTAEGGFRPLDWSLYGLLSLASVWLSRRDRRLADLPGPAMAIGLVLMLAWPHPTAAMLGMVLAGAGLIHGLPAMTRLWRADGRLSDAGTVAALAAAVWLVPWLQLAPTDHYAALLALAGTGWALGAAALGWRAMRTEGDPRLALLASTAATLGGVAAWFGLPSWAFQPAVAVIGAALLLIAPHAHDRQLERIGALFAAAAILLLALAGPDPLARPAGVPGHGTSMAEAARWAIPAAVAALFAVASRLRHARTGAIGAVMLGYVAAAQIVPGALLPLVPATAVAGLGLLRRSPHATIAAGLLAAAWAVAPLGQWLAGIAAATLGAPLFVTALPALTDVAIRLLAPALAAAVLLRRAPPARVELRRAWLVSLVLLVGAATHITYKHVLALDGTAAFVRQGLLERTGWEALLALFAVAAHRASPRAAAALAAAALAHFAWFTLLLHDPLWARQAVGAWPVANLLLPTCLVPFALLWAAGREPLPSVVERGRQGAFMLLILFVTATELRQLAHGSLPAVGRVGPAEDIARSLAAVALGVAFLLWGIRTRQRDWRLVSLLLMAGAAIKVFAFDAAGLDGLARIGSFAALGFSLIGVGWLYSRYLPAPTADADASAPAQA